MCTRVFNNREGAVLTTGRNMDWANPFVTTLNVFPKDTYRTGLPDNDESGYPPVTWKSEHNSVVAAVGGSAISDGVNSAGLVANILYLAGSSYEPEHRNPGMKGLSVLRWVQYVLDKFATVEQVVKEFSGNTELVIVGAAVPDEGSGEAKPAEVHMSVSDAKGDSAIIEVFNGVYQVSCNRSYRVMTNDPVFSKQLTLNDFWRWQWDPANRHKTNTLPGETYSPARFARAEYFVNHVGIEADENAAVAQNFSILANTAVPLGVEAPVDQPNIAPTLWSTVALHDALRYYFKDAVMPNVFWTDLKNTGKFKTFPSPGECLNLLVEAGDNYNYMAGCVNELYSVIKDPMATPQQD